MCALFSRVSRGLVPIVFDMKVSGNGKVWFHLAPSDDECAEMIAEMVKTFGEDEATILFGIPRQTLVTWRYHRRGMSCAGRRCVWLINSLMLHPERIKTKMDIVTWGKAREALILPSKKPDKRPWGGKTKPVSV